jgi:hypothetical protein
MQFNPDGSLKLSSKTLQQRKDDEDRMRYKKCVLIRKEVVNFSAPKKCVLHLKLSDALIDSRFVETIYNYFKENAAVPSRFIKVNEKEFDIEIGTDFRRCSDCTNLVNKYREFLDGDIIEQKGSCTFSGFRNNFSYEDHFE